MCKIKTLREKNSKEYVQKSKKCQENRDEDTTLKIEKTKHYV